MTEIELQPCKCGNPAELVERPGGWTVDCVYSPICVVLGECLPCKYDGPGTDFFDTPEEAAAYWNENRDAICKEYMTEVE